MRHPIQAGGRFLISIFIPEPTSEVEKHFLWGKSDFGALIKNILEKEEKKYALRCGKDEGLADFRSCRKEDANTG
jgi:hypothetical protein